PAAGRRLAPELVSGTDHRRRDHRGGRPVGDAYQDLLRVARSGRQLRMEDREPWRIGQIDENYRRSAVLILFGALDDLPSRAAEHAEGVGRDLDVLLVQ